MREYYLNNVDSEDIDDLLIKVEKSFQIKFADKELYHVITFGELCDHIINKVQLKSADDCTTQQAFYKLRDSFIKIDDKQNSISPDTLLTDLLPKETRIVKLKQLESHLGFNVSILRPPNFVSIILSVTLIIALILLFINWKVGLPLLAFSFIGIWVANKLGRELNVKTVGELVKKITRENY